jgi:hypothetical protein
LLQRGVSCEPDVLVLLARILAHPDTLESQRFRLISSIVLPLGGPLRCLNLLDIDGFQGVLFRLAALLGRSKS